MTKKGWKASKRKKIPVLSEKQRKTRLRFAKKYANGNADSERLGQFLLNR